MIRSCNIFIIESTIRVELRQDNYAPPSSCAGFAAGEIRSMGDAARAGDGDNRVKSTTSDASDERLMALE